MKRIASIDIFRAITMLLMVFVNDFWTLHGVPHWLEHTAVREDGMGLSDAVFPAFLFIVGLSIPFAIQARIKRGDSRPSLLLHILERTLALVVMGFFLVNHETALPNGHFSRNTTLVLMITGFFLIWNQYEKNRFLKIIPALLLKGAGIAILLGLALIYKGGSMDHPEWMRPHWWGILGLIGWAYLLVSVIYLLVGNRIWLMAILLVMLHALNAQEFRPFLGHSGFRIIVSASNHALVMSGVLATLIFMKFRDSKKAYLFPALLLIPAAISLAYGLWTRPLWGISKILATPSWTSITAGISFLLFALIYLIFDIFKQSRLAAPIMPAGRSALTCYLLPAVVYATLYTEIRKIPLHYTTGSLGLVKSLLFALLIVLLTGLLERVKIRIKL